jgi:hypothetical protein
MVASGVNDLLISAAWRYDVVMKRWRPMTPEELARAEQRLRHPAPGSRIEAAKNFGIDLTLLIAQLRLTPAEHARELQDAANSLERVRGLARKRA